MIELYQGVYYGEPVAQERVRSRMVMPKGKKPFVIHYDPKKSKDYKELLKKEIKLLQSKGISDNILSVPMLMSCKIYITRPKSVTREYPEVKPDLSNYVKGVEDAMNGLVYTDDSKIIGYTDSWKLYAVGEPRVEVTLFTVDSGIV